MRDKRIMGKYPRQADHSYVLRPGNRDIIEDGTKPALVRCVVWCSRCSGMKPQEEEQWTECLDCAIIGIES
jgi:hypothetical protein